tara:strand:- start:4007 stop:4468 length:462 start_codon:yes stop_codon:yes gene_type:complete
MAPSFMAVQTIGTVLSVFSAIQSGRARRAEAEFNRKQLEFKAKMQKLEATEKANLRLRDFDSAQASNLAFAAFIGRDPGDRSMKAFLDRQEEIAYQDVQALESGALIESSQTRRLAAMEGVRGRNAIVESYFNAASAITTGLYRYHVYKTDET